MKLIVLRECQVIDAGMIPVRLVAGDTIDIAEVHAKAAILRGLAVPHFTRDDARAGAPARLKAALQCAPEIG